MGTKTSNKKRTFAIPKGFISVFFTRLEESGLEYELTELDQEGDLHVQVEYSPMERDEVMDLVELEDEFYENEKNEEEHEDDQN